MWHFGAMSPCEITVFDQIQWFLSHWNYVSLTTWGQSFMNRGRQVPVTLLWHSQWLTKCRNQHSGFQGDCRGFQGDWLFHVLFSVQLTPSPGEEAPPTYPQTHCRCHSTFSSRSQKWHFGRRPRCSHTATGCWPSPPPDGEVPEQWPSWVGWRSEHCCWGLQTVWKETNLGQSVNEDM